MVTAWETSSMSCLLFRCLNTTIGVVVLLCCHSAVQAQVQPIRFQTPRLSLLWEEPVLKELRITDEQRQRIKAALGEFFEEGLDGQRRMKLPATGFHPSPEDMEQLEQRLEKIMNPEQVKRWNQLHLQRLGYRALGLPHIAKELKLTNAQETKVDNALEDFHRKLREKVKKLKHDGSTIRVTPEMMAELEKDLNQEMSQLLTPEQKQKWEELQGPKFTFTKRPVPQKDKH